MKEVAKFKVNDIVKITEPSWLRNKILNRFGVVMEVQDVFDDYWVYSVEVEFKDKKLQLLYFESELELSGGIE